MTDPNAQKQKQRRILMWVLFVPWAISLYFVMKNKEKVAEEEELQTSAAAVASPVDAIQAEGDLATRISSLTQYLESNDAGPEAQKAQMLLALAYLRQGEASVKAYNDWSPYKKAAETFEAFAKEHPGSPWNAHASYWAGRTYLEHVPDEEKHAIGLLTKLSFENRPVWLPPDDGTNLWSEQPALIAAGLLAEPYVENRLNYKIIDWCVRMCGGRQSPHAYVLALLLLAVVVKILVLPLGIRGHVAMKTMQAKTAAIQPLLNDIKKRYKDDQLKLMQEQSRIMKENGVSMAGGCLPQLIQLPFIFYVYSAIRLYTHHFANGQAFWIPDLSKPDLPLMLIYAASMIVTTKLTPQAPSADPQQQQSQKLMTYMMPVVLIFVLKGWPSAFIFYWAAFNIIATIQQVWLNKRFPAPVIALKTEVSAPKPIKAAKDDMVAGRDAGQDGRPSGPPQIGGILGRILGLAPPSSGNGADGDDGPSRARSKARKTRRRKPPSTGPEMPPPRLR